MRIFKKFRVRTALTVLAAVAVALVVGKSAGAASQGPILIMVAAGDNNAVLNQPETYAGAEAAVIRVNKTNPVGIHGRKIKLVICNTSGGDTNANTACARQAIADHVAAALWFDTFTTDSEPLLNAAHIPVIDTGSTKDEQTLPNSFPIGGGSAVTFGGDALYFANVKHAKSIALATAQTAPAQAIAQLAQTVITRLGVKYSGTVYYPLTAQDYTPYAQQLKSMNPDAVVLATSSTRLLALVQALHQVGYTGPIGACSACITLDASKQNASVVQGLYLAGNYPPATATGLPGMARFRADATAAQKRKVPHADNENDNMVQAWLGIQALATIGNKYIPKGKTVNNITMQAALAKAKNVNLQGLGTWSPGGKGITQGADAPKVTYGLAWILQIQPHGNRTLVTKKALDVIKSAKLSG